ncbi:MAG: imidazole glycerol phosphate synthase subunit HisH [Candidatus Theseobacter exili]|nr:imidazole glycerol phosphate synthase subunit HisH [Candidatus Theseobacter exili]
MSIAIIDYGMGNLRSVQKALEHLGYETVVTSNPDEIVSSDKVVFPGVGAFGDCMKNLENLGLINTINEVINLGKPFLGICLGLQSLFSESDESQIYKGLDVILGKVERFPEGLKIPHMGWNQVVFTEKGRTCPILKGIEEGTFFYFVHSYFVHPSDKSCVALESEYGDLFTAMIWKDNIFALQFHPEKSQKQGLKLLDNFGKL